VRKGGGHRCACALHCADLCVFPMDGRYPRPLCYPVLNGIDDRISLAPAATAQHSTAQHASRVDITAPATLNFSVAAMEAHMLRSCLRPTSTSSCTAAS
jgi:hypothetical protein